MIDITFDIPKIKEPDFRPVGDAMRDTGEMVSGVFKSALTGAVLPGMTGPVHMKNPEVTYQTPGEFEVVVNTPDLSSIERGKEPWDMKPAIYSGPKHRVARDGTWYVIVPFFHNRDKMPEEIRAMADQLEMSEIIGRYIDGLGVERNLYRWGEGGGGPWRLPNMPTTLTSMSVSKTGYVRRTNKYSGMVRMKGAGFMTFRVASEKSPPESWWHPGIPANPVTNSVRQLVFPYIDERLTAAWAEVIRNCLA